MFSTPCDPVMSTAGPLRTALLVSACLLLMACDELFPGQRRPVVVMADSTAAQPKRQPSPPRETRPPADSAQVAAAFRQMSQTLRRLVAAEQGFYAENGTYSGDLSRVGFKPVGETVVEFLWVGKDGWGARGTHPALPDRDCVVYTGAASAAPATRRYGRTGREGAIVCDADRLPVRPAPPAPGAPAPKPAPEPVDTTNALDAVSPVVQMRVDLRKLGEAQAAYFGTQGMYSRQISRLPLQFGWQRGVSITLLHADQRSWTARATHESRPGKSCVVWFGSPPTRPATSVQRKVPDRSGVAVCDD